MKYFHPSYWLKLWVLSAPLFNSKNKGIYAKSIDHQNIKDWASNNTNLELIENQARNWSNNQTIKFPNHENISSSKNLETDGFYENFLKTQGWSNNPEIAQQQLIEIQEEHHQFLYKEHKIRKLNKRQGGKRPRPNGKLINDLFKTWSTNFDFANYDFDIHIHARVANRGLSVIHEIILRSWNINTFDQNIPSQGSRVFQVIFNERFSHSEIDWDDDHAIITSFNELLSDNIINSVVNYEQVINLPNSIFHSNLRYNEFITPSIINNRNNILNTVSQRSPHININDIIISNENQNTINDNYFNIFYPILYRMIVMTFNNHFPFIFSARSSYFDRFYGIQNNQNNLAQTQYFMIDAISQFIENDPRNVQLSIFNPVNLFFFNINMYDFIFILNEQDISFAYAIHEETHNPNRALPEDLAYLNIDTTNRYINNMHINNDIATVTAWQRGQMEFILWLVEFVTNILPNRITNDNCLVNKFLRKFKRNKRQDSQVCTYNFSDASIYSNLIKNENIKKIYLVYTNDGINGKIKKGDQIILTDKNLYYFEIQNLLFKKINYLNQDIKYLFFDQLNVFNFYFKTSQNEFYLGNLQTLELHKIIIKDKLINKNVFLNILEIINKNQKIYEFSPFLIEEIYNNQIFNNYLIKNNQREIYQVNLYKKSILKLDCSTTKEIDKEVVFFYQKNKSDVEIKNENTKIFDFNLGNINPLDYQKIEFLGNKFETSSFWGLLYHIDTGKNISYFNGYNLSNLIINERLTNSVEIEDNSNQILLPLQTTTIGWASATVQQSFGLSFYWNHNYYLQLFIHQHSSKNNWAWNYADNIINIGKGIKLYNDNNFKNKKNTGYVEFVKKNNEEKIITSKDWDDYDNNDYNNQNNVIIEENLGNINPLDYQKIEFLGSIDNFHQSRVSWGNEKYYVEHFLDDFNNKNIVDIITNYKFDKNNNYWDPTTCKIMLQNEKVEETWHSKLTWKMCLGLSFYWENNNYYLQILIRQYGHSNTMSIWSYGGALFTGIGKGIRLYNYDNELENQIPNSNDRKKREVFEEKNITKWNSYVTKFINNEKHLPINNKTNFISSNITSLQNN